MGVGARQDITVLGPTARAALVKAAGHPPYRAAQLERWLYPRAAASFDEMTDLPAAFRADLDRRFYIPLPAPVEEAADDAGTTKYLLKTRDGHHVETVYMPGGDYDAACLSSQLGCIFACRICATGRLKFRRNLTAYEMFAQFALIQRSHPEERVRNAVFMGQGEPLANYDATREAAALLKTHFGLGARRITISTAGLPDKIAAWADEGPPVNLAVSLNSARQETRDELMPGVARYPLPDLARACRYYAHKTGRRVTFEYVLCAGVNDDAAHARGLVYFTKTIPSKINVIPFNPWPKAPYRPPTEERLEAFLAVAARGRAALTVRRSRGRGISAACGTLANRALHRKGNKPPCRTESAK